MLFIFLVVKTFGIEISDGSTLNFKLTDHKGTPIPVENFVGIVKTFHKSDFTLVVEYESTSIPQNAMVVTPKVSNALIIANEISNNKLLFFR